MVLIYYYLFFMMCHYLVFTRFFRKRHSFAATIMYFWFSIVWKLPLRVADVLINFFFLGQMNKWLAHTEEQNVGMLSAWCEQHKMQFVMLDTNLPLPGTERKQSDFWEYETGCSPHYNYWRRCNPTEILCVILPVILLWFIRMYLPCQRKSEFDDEEVSIKESKTGNMA